MEGSDSSILILLAVIGFSWLTETTDKIENERPFLAESSHSRNLGVFPLFYHYLHNGNAMRNKCPYIN